MWIALWWISYIALLVCLIIVIVKMFQTNHTALGIITILTTVFCGFGPLIGFIWGWIKASDYGLKTVMLIWTVIWIANLGVLAFAYTELRAMFEKMIPVT